jgi:putative proteasome-type protease
LEEQSHELDAMTRAWIDSLRHAFFELPHFPWEQPEATIDGASENPQQMQG